MIILFQSGFWSSVYGVLYRCVRIRQLYENSDALPHVMGIGPFGHAEVLAWPYYLVCMKMGLPPRLYYRIDA